MGSNALIVTIPGTPDAVLSPNSRVHWGRKVRPKRDARQAAWAAVLEARGLGGWMDWQPPITLHVVIAWEKGRKRMDDDNAHAILKATIDGIADAIGVNDKHITLATVQQDRDPEGRGFVKIAIEQNADERKTA